MADTQVQQVVHPVVSRLRTWLDRLPPTPTRVVRRLLDREVLLAGSSLAFYGLVSALPLALISLTVAEGVVGRDTVQRISQQASATQAGGIGQILSDLTNASVSPGWGVFLLALWPATAYGAGLRRAFIEANGDREALPGLKGRLIGLLLVLLLPVVLMAGFPLTFVLSRLGGEGLGGTLVGVALALVGGALVGTIVNTVLYHAFTNEGLGWRSTVATAAGVASVTSLMSLGFVLYLRLGELGQRYGSAVLGAVLVLAVWLLAVNVLLLAGYHAIIEVDQSSGEQADER